MNEFAELKREKVVYSYREGGREEGMRCFTHDNITKHLVVSFCF